MIEIYTDLLERRKTDFVSPDGKYLYDARNVIAQAKRCRERLGVLVKPADLLTRRDDGEISAMNRAIGIELKRQLAEQSGQADAGRVQDKTEEAPAGVQDKILPPEQAEILINALKARFEKNQELHQGIFWADVKRALRAAPNLMWSLQQLESSGGEPDVLEDSGDAFLFGDFSEESPSGRRNVVFNFTAEAFLREHYPREVCNGNAADRVAEWNVEFMSEAEYHLLQRLKRVDSSTQSWLRTSVGLSRGLVALRGYRKDEDVYIYRHAAYNHNEIRGFRCSLSVPKV